MAAETGSGKTGAFCLPVIQIVQESKRINLGQSASKSRNTATNQQTVCRLNMDDRSDIVAISPSGKEMQTRDFKMWGGARATMGILSGKERLSFAIFRFLLLEPVRKIQKNFRISLLNF